MRCLSCHFGRDLWCGHSAFGSLPVLHNYRELMRRWVTCSAFPCCYFSAVFTPREKPQPVKFRRIACVSNNNPFAVIINKAPLQNKSMPLITTVVEPMKNEPCLPENFFTRHHYQQSLNLYLLNINFMSHRCWTISILHHNFETSFLGVQFKKNCSQHKVTR